MSRPTLENHWGMVEREKDLPYSFEAAVVAAGWMISGNPLPYCWDEDRKPEFRDGQGNIVDTDAIEVLNFVPGLLLEIRSLRIQISKQEVKA